MQIEDLFTPAQQALVADLHRRDQQERQAGSTDPLRLRAVSPQVAHYLCLTAIQQQARTLVEFGTSHGYSTLHLAAAAQRTGGRVFSLDRVPEKTAAAQANLRQAGLDHVVECYTGEGDAFVATLPSEWTLSLWILACPHLRPCSPCWKAVWSEGLFSLSMAGPKSSNGTRTRSGSPLEAA